MAKADSAGGGTSAPSLNIEFMRSLVKQYSELGQWSSALFWADAAAGAGAASSSTGRASGDDVWLLASALLAQGELHRAAHAVTAPALHRHHLLCLGVAMRAHVAAREPAAALSLMEECDPMLLEPRTADQTHNRALSGVLVCQARALSLLDRRDAAATALGSALRADAACVEAFTLLLEQRALTNAQESELVESLPLSSQLSPAEAALLRAAYRDRLTAPPTADTSDSLSAEVQAARARSADGAISRARRLCNDCDWGAALKALDSVDGWCAPEVRVACLVQLRRSSELFALAHTLVDAYPHTWQAWYAVGCYYYLIRKNEFARRYLSKAKSVQYGAGAVWLAYGHCFAIEGEHDQAIAAYFKAGQLMPGCPLPPLYVGVEHAQLNNFPTAERFLVRAAQIHDPTPQSSEECGGEECDESSSGWQSLARSVRCPYIAHEAGCAALSAGHAAAAARLWLRAVHCQPEQLSPRWAATLDALGHACRRLGQPAEALQWHERALALRPQRADTYAAMGLCLALMGRELEAADALHAALSRSPDDVVAQALLDAVMDRVDSQLTEEEIPQFKFPAVSIPRPAASPAGTPVPHDNTNMSDMSMSFD